MSLGLFYFCPATNLAKLSEIVDAGTLKPLLDETRFGLEEIGKAHERLTGRQAIGKVVVEV